MSRCKTCKEFLISGCFEWSESLTELNTSLHTVKHLVCSQVVMAQDRSHWLMWLVGALLFSAMVQTCKGFSLICMREP